MRHAVLYGAVFMLLWFIFLDAASVQACAGAGGDTHLNKKIKNADVIVSGHFVSVDDSNRNGQFKVDSYIKGNPGESHLLIVQDLPLYLLTQYESRRNGCYQLHPKLELNTNTIALLTQRLDGSYAPVVFGKGIYQFTEGEQITVEYKIEREESLQSVLVELNYDDFIEFFAEHFGFSSVQPQKTSALPRTVPLLISTSTQAPYILPVDENIPLRIPVDDTQYPPLPSQCAAVPCDLVSPNGLDEVYLRNDMDNRSYDERKHTIRGNAALFSPTSDAIAVWVNSD